MDAPKKTSSASSKQSWVCAGVFTSGYSIGSMIGFSAVLNPQLKKDSRFDLQNDTESWITSVIGFGLIVGTILAPGVMAKYGRKPANITALTIITFGWLLLTLANNVVTIIIARFLKGIGMGFVDLLNGITISECVSPSKRGYYSVISVSVGYGVGVIFIHMSGILLHWKIVSGLSCIIPVLGLIIFIILPETPYWLASKGRYEESRDSFHRLRGNKEKSENELETMINARISENQQTKSNPTLVSDMKNVIASLGKTELLKPLIVAVHLYGLVQISGTNVFLSYSIVIIDQLVVLPGGKINMTLFLTTVNTLRLIGVLISVVLIKYFNRRTVLYISSLFSMLTMLSLALCSYLQSLHDSWIVMLLIYIYVFSSGVGVTPLPFAICGEIFPMKVKDLGIFLGAIALHIFMFITLKTAPNLMKTCGIHGLFLIYSVIMVYFLVVLWFTLPETRGRTLQDIEENFQKVKFTAVPSKDTEIESESYLKDIKINHVDL